MRDNIFCVLFLVLLIMFNLILPIKATDAGLAAVINKARAIKGENVLQNFYTDTEKCISENVYDKCDSPLLPNGDYTCLGVWFECITQTSFYKKYSFLYPMDLALEMALNYSSSNPLIWGTQSSDLIKNTNDIVFLTSSARILLYQTLSKYSKTTDFWQQLVDEFSYCNTISMGEEGSEYPVCGKSAVACYNGDFLQCFKKQPFYKSYNKILPLDKILKSQNFSSPNTQSEVIPPECDSTNTCTTMEVEDYFEKRRNTLFVNLFIELFERADVGTSKDWKTGFWVLFGISTGFLVIIFFAILVKYFRKHDPPTFSSMYQKVDDEQGDEEE